jgi:hypothetical protein
VPGAWPEYNCKMLGHRLNGVVVPGTRSASSNLQQQIPLIAEEFPEIENCHRGSINLLLEGALRIDNPDHQTGQILWQRPPGEVFGFLRIRFEYPINAAPRRAWIYIPHDSPHFRLRCHIEVLTEEKVQGLAYGARCRVHLPRCNFEPGVLVV